MVIPLNIRSGCCGLGLEARALIASSESGGGAGLLLFRLLADELLALACSLSNLQVPLISAIDMGRPRLS